ncbi:MAG: choice-of-anchor Q domain-containing protein [Dokdonella sp.]
MGSIDRLPCARPLCAALAAALALASFPATAGQPAGAAAPASAFAPRGGGGGSVVVVTNCDDSGPGSLRDAVVNAVAQDAIDVSQLPCADSTITLTSGAIPVTAADLVISGVPLLRAPGDAAHAPAPAGVFAPPIIDGNGTDRIFDHSGTGHLYLDNLKLRHGVALGGGGCVRSTGSLTMFSITASGCSANEFNFGDASGGGISVDGSVYMNTSHISGNTANGVSFVRGGGLFVGGSLMMKFSTISGNSAIAAAGGYGFGGGLYAGSVANLGYSTISGNSAKDGGGVALFAADGSTLSIVDCTISGNSGAIGGMLVSTAALQMASTTIAFNTSTVAGGTGGLALGRTSNLQSTLIAHNLSPDGPSDVAADCGMAKCSQAVEGANNLFMAATLTVPPDTLSTDPLLLGLTDNGGPTQTHALAANSPAIDHGNALGLGGTSPVNSDQRYYGYGRVVGISADIGAFEFGAAPDRIFTNGFDLESRVQP